MVKKTPGDYTLLWIFLIIAIIVVVIFWTESTPGYTSALDFAKQSCNYIEASKGK